MKGLVKTAKLVASKRECEECPYKTMGLCGSVQKKVCDKVFVSGFTVGIDHYKERLWKTANKSPKANTPLLLYLSDDTMALGSFEGWGYSFSVPTEKLHKKVEVVAWLYISDLF